MKNINLDYHTYLQIRRHETEKQIRREYTVARDIIRKRIKQMDKTGTTGLYKKGIRIKGKFYAGQIDPREYGFYQKYKDGIPRLRDLSLEEASKELAEMKQWLMRPESTVSGLYQSVRARTAGLRQSGYKGVKSSDFASFGKFMQQYRSMHLDHIVGSPETAEVYITATKKDLTVDEMIDNLKLFAQYKSELDRANESTLKQLTGDPGKLRKYLETLS